MMRWIAIGCMLAATFTAAAQTPAASTTSSTGAWKIDGDVQGTPVKMNCLLTEADHKLTGTCISDAGDTTPRKLTGEVTAKGVSWHFDTDYQGTPITVALTATLSTDGTRMNGTISVPQMTVDGTFVATRSPASDATPSPASAAQPTGTTTGIWKVNGDVQGTSVIMTCTLAQSNATLTGTCSGASQEDTADRKLTGSVTEKTVAWKFDTVYQGGAITVSMTATLSPDGTKMNGTMSVMPLGVDGTFSAAKQ